VRRSYKRIGHATDPCEDCDLARGLGGERTISANFEMRRDAEAVVEHLVQEHGINRSDIFRARAFPS